MWSSDWLDCYSNSSCSTESLSLSVSFLMGILSFCSPVSELTDCFLITLFSWLGLEISSVAYDSEFMFSKNMRRLACMDLPPFSLFTVSLGSSDVGLFKLKFFLLGFLLCTLFCSARASRLCLNLYLKFSITLFCAFMALSTPRRP